MAVQIKRKDVEEYKKCKEDPIYFIEKYIKIITVDYGLKDFVLYDYQKEIINTLKNNRYVLILQARQSGKTALMSAYLVWKALFFADSSHCIVANKHDTAKSIMQRVKSMYDSLEVDYLRMADQNRWSKTEIAFNNKSYILSCATSNNSARGLSLNTLYIDEANFIGANGTKDEEFLQSVMPTISSGKSSQFILTSSAGTTSGFYYDLYKDAKEGKNEFKVVEIDWKRVPEYIGNPNFKEEMVSKIGISQFQQEFENDFRVGLNITEVPYFNDEILDELKRSFYQEYFGLKELYVREMPDPSRNFYVAAIDISEGINRDYSVIAIFKVNFDAEITYDLVAYYRSNSTPPFQLSKVIKQISDIFSLKSMIIERNGPGCAVIDTLLKMYDMKNLYYTDLKKERVYGISIKQQNKQEGMIAMKSFIEKDKKVVVESDLFLNECMFYTSRGRAKKGYDDSVSTLILLCYVVKNQNFDEIAKTLFYEDQVDITNLLQINNSDSFAEDNMIDEQYVHFYEIFGYPGETATPLKI